MIYVSEFIQFLQNNNILFCLDAHLALSLHHDFKNDIDINCPYINIIINDEKTTIEKIPIFKNNNNFILIDNYKPFKVQKKKIDTNNITYIKKHNLYIYDEITLLNNTLNPINFYSWFKFYTENNLLNNNILKIFLHHNPKHPAVLDIVQNKYTEYNNIIQNYSTQHLIFAKQSFFAAADPKKQKFIYCNKSIDQKTLNKIFQNTKDQLDFIIDKNKKLIIGYDHGYLSNEHSFVLGAGTIGRTDSSYRITNRSGHYMPDNKKDMEYTKQIFIANNIIYENF